MDRVVRTPLTFDCGGATLAGMLHPGRGTTGVVIVSGGVQTRVGSHRGFVLLADRLAAAGFPTLRFDRRGVGDSDGDDAGYRASAADLAAAIAALRRASPQVRRIIGWGLCDGASALALHGAALGLDGMILANPWTRDGDAAVEMPPRAAITARYRQRLTSPSEWRRLLHGGLDLGKAVRGLLHLARPEATPALAVSLAVGMERFNRPMLILLAGRDATAQAFAALWREPAFALGRARSDIELVTLPDATHTFARSGDIVAMAERCVEWVRSKEW